MLSLIERYWHWDRVPVGDATSRFVRELAADLEAPFFSVASGAECLTWVVPPRWRVNVARLTGPDGAILCDYHRNPLTLRSYSASFRGEVTREELIEHVRSDPARPERTIYDYRSQYKYGERTEWGFSLPHRTVESLAAGTYRVEIDTVFDDGEMDVIDWTLPGRRPETIFLAAHTCHTAQVNDGLACVAIIAELFRRLRRRPDRTYTYRAILGPEYFAAAAVLDRGERVENLIGGFYLDMLANGRPLGYQTSSSGRSYVDMATANVLSHHVPDAFHSDFRDLWGNDEMFYDGPDFFIPTVGMGRELFDDYHTDNDDLAHLDAGQLADSLAVLERIVDAFETDYVPVRTYRGPLYQSRYDLYVDVKTNQQGYFQLQNIQALMDGRRSCLEIAGELGVDFEFVRGFADRLGELGLAQRREHAATRDVRYRFEHPPRYSSTRG